MRACRGHASPAEAGTDKRIRAMELVHSPRVRDARLHHSNIQAHLAFLPRCPVATMWSRLPGCRQGTSRCLQRCCLSWQLGVLALRQGPLPCTAAEVDASLESTE